MYVRSDLVRRHDDSLIAPTTATALVADRLRSRGAGEVNVAAGSVGCVGAHAERGPRGGAGGAVDFMVCLRRHESDQLIELGIPTAVTIRREVYRAVGAGRRCSKF